MSLALRIYFLFFFFSWHTCMNVRMVEKAPSRIKSFLFFVRPAIKSKPMWKSLVWGVFTNVYVVGLRDSCLNANPSFFVTRRLFLLSFDVDSHSITRVNPVTSFVLLKWSVCKMIINWSSYESNEYIMWWDGQENFLRRDWSGEKKVISVPCFLVTGVWSG